MEEVSFSNIKQKNDIKNDIIIYRFVNALIYLIIFIFFNNLKNNIYFKWGLGIGDWGLGIGDWGLGPIPNPHEY